MSVSWMWADSALAGGGFFNSMAKKNPLRWSKVLTLEAAIEELEKLPDGRPVLTKANQKESRHPSAWAASEHLRDLQRDRVPSASLPNLRDLHRDNGPSSPTSLPTSAPASAQNSTENASFTTLTQDTLEARGSSGTIEACREDDDDSDDDEAPAGPLCEWPEDSEAAELWRTWQKEDATKKIRALKGLQRTESLRMQNEVEERRTSIAKIRIEESFRFVEEESFRLQRTVSGRAMSGESMVDDLRASWAREDNEKRDRVLQEQSRLELDRKTVEEAQSRLADVRRQIAAEQEQQRRRLREEKRRKEEADQRAMALSQDAVVLMLKQKWAEEDAKKREQALAHGMARADAARAVAPRPGPSFSPGQEVQVYSDSTRTWTDGVVTEVASVSSSINGAHVPAGSIGVRYGNRAKWVPPDLVGEVLRFPQGISRESAAPRLSGASTSGSMSAEEAERKKRVEDERQWKVEAERKQQVLEERRFKEEAEQQHIMGVAAVASTAVEAAEVERQRRVAQERQWKAERDSELQSRTPANDSPPKKSGLSLLKSLQADMKQNRLAEEQALPVGADDSKPPAGMRQSLPSQEVGLDKFSDEDGKDSAGMRRSLPSQEVGIDKFSDKDGKELDKTQISDDCEPESGLSRLPTPATRSGGIAALKALQQQKQQQVVGAYLAPQESDSALEEAEDVVRRYAESGALTPQLASRLAATLLPLSRDSGALRAILKVHGWTGEVFSAPPDAGSLLLDISETNVVPLEHLLRDSQRNILVFGGVGAGRSEFIRLMAGHEPIAETDLREMRAEHALALKRARPKRRSSIGPTDVFEVKTSSSRALLFRLPEATKDLEDHVIDVVSRIQTVHCALFVVNGTPAQLRPGTEAALRGMAKALPVGLERQTLLVYSFVTSREMCSPAMNMDFISPMGEFYLDNPLAILRGHAEEHQVRALFSMIDWDAKGDEDLEGRKCACAMKDSVRVVTSLFDKIHSLSAADLAGTTSCFRPACANLAWNGKPGSYCGRECRAIHAQEGVPPEVDAKRQKELEELRAEEERHLKLTEERRAAEAERRRVKDEEEKAWRAAKGLDVEVVPEKRRSRRVTWFDEEAFQKELEDETKRELKEKRRAEDRRMHDELARAKQREEKQKREEGKRLMEQEREESKRLMEQEAREEARREERAGTADEEVDALMAKWAAEDVAKRDQALHDYGVSEPAEKKDGRKSDPGRDNKSSGRRGGRGSGGGRGGGGGDLCENGRRIIRSAGSQRAVARRRRASGVADPAGSFKGISSQMRDQSEVKRLSKRMRKVQLILDEVDPVELVGLELLVEDEDRGKQILGTVKGYEGEYFDVALETGESVSLEGIDASQLVGRLPSWAY